MIKLNDKSDCCGCTACYSICPVNAIIMKEDEEGFKYPLIDESKCINCGLCEKVCPFLKTIENKTSTQMIYGGYTKKDDILDKSSSGGIFYFLANHILSLKGCVFGAMYDEKLHVYHEVVTKKEDLIKLMGSKYVQSDLNGVFLKVKELLQKNKFVLFSGTPCQIKGLKLFLRKEYEKLYCCDFICHGVPSPMVYKKRIEQLQQQNNNKIKFINFREKNEGWKNYQIAYGNASFVKKNYFYDDPYMKGFLKNIYLRPSCYNCKVKGNNRLSEITLGDYWGINEKNERFNKKGNSIIICHTEKGEKIIDEIKHNLNLYLINNYDFYNLNSAYNSSANKSDDRNKFFLLLRKKGINKAFKKYKLYPTSKRKIMLTLSRLKRTIIRSEKNEYFDKKHK